MKFVPRDDRVVWHQRALNAAREADLHSALELFTEAKETEWLADLVRTSSDEALEDVSHYATEPAAKRLEKNHPGLAARLWCAQGLRIVNAKKSKYYDAALSNFERARDCYQRVGWRPNGSKRCAGFARRITVRSASSMDFRPWLPARNAANAFRS